MLPAEIVKQGISDEFEMMLTQDIVSMDRIAEKIDQHVLAFCTCSIAPSKYFVCEECLVVL